MVKAPDVMGSRRFDSYRSDAFMMHNMENVVWCLAVGKTTLCGGGKGRHNLNTSVESVIRNFRQE